MEKGSECTSPAAYPTVWGLSGGHGTRSTRRGRQWEKRKAPPACLSSARMRFWQPWASEKGREMLTGPGLVAHCFLCTIRTKTALFLRKSEWMWAALEYREGRIGFRTTLQIQGGPLFFTHDGGQKRQCFLSAQRGAWLSFNGAETYPHRSLGSLRALHAASDAQ